MTVREITMVDNAKTNEDDEAERPNDDKPEKTIRDATHKPAAASEDVGDAEGPSADADEGNEDATT